MIFDGIDRAQKVLRISIRDGLSKAHPPPKGGINMSEASYGSNWKLKLRYGRLVTPYKHFTAIADGMVDALQEGFECRPGAAFMTMKTWATNADESAHMIGLIGQQLGFRVTGKIEVYATEPEQPPSDNPRGYDISFVPYDES